MTIRGAIALPLVAVLFAVGCGPSPVLRPPTPTAVSIVTGSAVPVTIAPPTAVPTSATPSVVGVASPTASRTPLASPSAVSSATPSPVVPAAPTATVAPTPSPVPATPTPAPSPVPPTTAPAANYYTSFDLPPACPAVAPGGPTCAVGLPVGGTTQATSADYVLFRVGDAEPTKDACVTFQNSTTVTMTLDGRAVPFVTLPCGYATPPGGSPEWWVDYRYLSPPLTPGTHTASATWAGSAPQSFTRSLVVSP